MSRMYQFYRTPGRWMIAFGFLLPACLVGRLHLPALAQEKGVTQAPVDPEHAAKMARGLGLFKKEIKPVLVQRCVRCHGGKEIEAKLDLTDRTGLLRGGTAGPAIIVGKAKDSLLYKLIAHAREPHMPHNAAKLPADVIGRIALWIDNGAPYDGPLVTPIAKEPSWTEKRVAADARQFWSFQPLQRHGMPEVRNAAWPRTGADRFILEQLERAGLQPNPSASRRQLIRRAYFDLIGMPPTPEEVDSALGDTSERWYDKVVDQLLKSPHYGERWARHWLDVARFAESHGFEHDYDRPSAYHYRDFVIKALNSDLPYDTFVKWQIAGDEYEPDNNLALTATGFLAAGVHSTQITRNEVERHRYDEMDDMLATVGSSMLGLTLGCARCHDHKFDPIPQRDYYRLVSTFTTTVRSEINLDLDPDGYKKAQAAFDKEHEPFRAAVRRYETDQLPPRQAELLSAWQRNPERPAFLALDGISSRGFKIAGLVRWLRTTDPEWRRLQSQADQHLKKAPKPRIVKAMISSEGLPAVRLHSQGEDFFKETYFLRRGDTNQKDGLARQGFLQVLIPAADSENRWQTPPPANWRTSYRRRALAEWLTDADQGAGRLLARVMVNRLWQHHMGRGLVATPNDFGLRGEKPTHPELLDWLATELIRSGWRLKPLHKLIMTSAVYQQSAQVDEARFRVDRDNRLFWRRPRQRLEGEVIRDALLACGGSLDSTMYGPGTLDENSKRRSIYFTVKRSRLLPMMQVFDAPEALVSVGERPTTTIAPQALLLMNNANVRACARSMAVRIAPDHASTVAEAVQRGYLTALARAPSAAELGDSVTFVNQQMASYRAAGKARERELALADFCQVLMCLNEFVYLD